MKIVQAAMAGTLESSDLMVKVSPDESGLDVVIQSEVYKQFGDRIAEVVHETLAAFNIEQGQIIIDDKGALHCSEGQPGKTLHGKRYNEKVTSQYVIYSRFKCCHVVDGIYL